jgi:outer membrane protein OmpA-like peptidoglycan-associated protein
MSALWCVNAITVAAQEAQPAPPERTGAHIRTIEITDAGGQILSFRHLEGATVVEMRGTKLLPAATTRMKVQSRAGFTEIDINAGEILNLPPASRFGKDFLTYVLWAVSVDGEPMNLGEITFNEFGPVSINVTTPYQTFWMMITAEPDFAVNDPSPLVVMYSINQDNTATSNKALAVEGKLLYHTYYTQYETTAATPDTKVPNELLQARKAVELAAESGILAHPTPAGEEPLPDEQRTRQTLEQARDFLGQAEESMKAGRSNQAIRFARTAAQIAENARALALGAAGGLYARQLERDMTKLQEEIEALQARLAAREKELAELRSQLEQERAAAADARRQCEEEIARMRQQLNALEKAFQDSVRELEASKRQLRDEREKICGELRRQLARLGQLSDQGGSLVLTLASDILFDFNSAELRPAARENLAKLATIRLLLFPEASVRYEGHTDRVGEDDYNQWLSEQRALSVYRYFLEESTSQETDEAARESKQQLLAAVAELQKMPYAAVRRAPEKRQELMARLGDAVVGMGERQPVEDTEKPSERNRRVVLLFPPAQMGQASSLCEAPPQQ